MSDSIRSIRYIPPIQHLNQKGKTGDKKGDKEGKKDKKDFSHHLSSKDEDVKGKDSNLENEQHKDSGQHKDKNSLQSRKEDDLDGTCGTILDTEV
ncbi:MAG: hypothetical protein ACUZ8N_17725 [Candidatus Scalindua sp.]